MSALLRHVALVSQSPQVSTGDLMRISAALQKQSTRDLAPVWNVAATVDPYERIEDVPLDYWPVLIVDPAPNLPAGVHLDRHGQPYALVEATTDRDVLSLVIAHEICEMLVDPFGNRLVAGNSVMPGQGRVNYLVEVCDPSEKAQFAYTVNGVLVADFYTPRFFDPVAAPGARYSFTGAIPAPRTILDGGYLSWVDLATGIWWQQIWFGTPKPTFRKLGRLSGKGSLRSQIDRKTAGDTANAVAAGRTNSLFALAGPDVADSAAAGRAAALREDIGKLAPRA